MSGQRTGPSSLAVEATTALLLGTFAGFALAAFHGGVLLSVHRVTRTSQLPLGPFLLLGALAAITVTP